MSLKSMTGFARKNGLTLGWQWSWEIKSVNARGLDVRVRLPEMLDNLDIAIKKQIGKKIARGTVYANLELVQVKKTESTSKITVNREFIEDMLDLIDEYDSSDKLGSTSLGQLLAVKGVVDVENIEFAESLIENLEKSVLVGFEHTLSDLIKARSEEGAALSAILDSHISMLDALLTEIKACDGVRLEYIQGKFKEKCQTLLADDNIVSNERLEQEVAILAVKADINEEINRLSAHIESAREKLKAEAPVGRQYDFLAQELNREVNTICSKSSDIELTKLGLDMKAHIDMLREQIQNLE